MSSDLAPEKPPRRPLALVLWTLVGLAVMVPFTALVLVLIPDGKLEPRSEMEVTFPALEVNPLAEYLDGSASISQADLTALRQLSTDSGWKPEAAAGLLARHQGTLEGFQELAKKDDQPWAWPGLTPGISFHTPLPNGQPLMEGARLVRLAARVHRENGELDQAIGCAEQLIRVGDAACEPVAPLIYLLISRAVLVSGWAEIREILLNPTLSAEQLTRVAQILDGVEVSPTELGHALRLETRFFANSIDSWPAFGPSGAASKLAPLLFHPNDTLNRHSAGLSQIVTAIEAGARSPAVEKIYEQQSAVFEKRDTLGFYLDPNLTGKLVLGTGMLGESVFKAHYRHLAEARLLRVLGAIRRHELESGRDLESLESLVPTYLAEIPPDPFANDGTLIWDPVKRLLYSVGENGQDDGGNFSTTAAFDRGEPDFGCEVPNTAPTPP